MLKISKRTQIVLLQPQVTSQFHFFSVSERDFRFSYFSSFHSFPKLLLMET